MKTGLRASAMETSSQSAAALQFANQSMDQMDETQIFISHLKHTHSACSTCTTNAVVCEAQRQEVSQLYASSKAAGSEQVKKNESKFRIRSEEKIISSLQLLNINSTNRNVLTHKLKNFKQEEAQIYSDSLLVSVSQLSQFVLSCGFSSLRRSDPSESVITSLCNCTEMKETKCVFRFRNRCLWKTHSVFSQNPSKCNTGESSPDRGRGCGPKAN